MSRALIQAEYAVDYVANTVRIKTGNRWEGINRGPSEDEKTSTNKLVGESRGFAQRQYQMLVKNEKIPKGGLGEADVRAQVAAHVKVGNCTEQSALAFEWLRKRGEQGLAWIEFVDCNHMIALLGLISPPNPEDSFKLRETTPASWSPGAVVCDPWAHDWYRVASDWHRKIGQLLAETTGGATDAGTLIKVKCRAYA